MPKKANVSEAKPKKSASNLYTMYEYVYDYEGKKHKVYPCPIKYVDEVINILSKTNLDYIFFNFMKPAEEPDGTVIRDDEGRIVYSDIPKDELFTLIEVALRFEETREEIAEWLDLGLAEEIVEELIYMGQLKKKNLEKRNLKE